MNAVNIGDVHPLPPVKERPTLGKYIARAKAYMRSKITEIRTPALTNSRPSSRISKFRLTTTQARYVFQYLKAGEYIESVVHGHVFGIGNAIIVATDSRIIYLQETLFYRKYEQLPYEDVGCIMLTPTPESLSRLGIYTKTKTYRLANVNARAAQEFISTVASSPAFDL